MDADDLRDWRETTPKRVRVRHGRDGERGEQGERGESGLRGERGEQGLRGERGPVGPKGNTGEVGKQGPRGERGEQGPAGKDGLKGEPGLNGEDGELGPIPRHELDPEENPHRIRFELERNYDTGKTTKWGEWIDLRRLLPKIVGRGAGGSTLNERRVREMIERFAPTDPAATGDFERVEVTYVSATDNRPSRIVYAADDGTETESRYDWGTGDPGTYQYKGTAPANTPTSGTWTIFRTTLDSDSRPGVRDRLAGAWDSRASLPWP